jgi:4-hydroxy-4-methyl-2-oxoglutarate aldolase
MNQDILKRYSSLPLGNVCDANGKYGNMDSAIRPLDNSFKLAGKAYCVRCHPRDNLAIHKAMYECEPGSVLVVDAGGFANCGYFGDIMALGCQARGIAGLVIDGGVRDSGDIVEMGFPVFSRSVNSGGTVKETVGQCGGAVVCGGVRVNTGDLIVADRDGVVVIEAENIEKTLSGAEAIAAKETEVRKLLEEGKSTIEIYRFSKLLG